MPVVTIAPLGTSVGNGNSRAVLPKRDGTKGWTASSSRRNAAFLRSVDGSVIEDRGLVGVAFTGTLGPRFHPNETGWAQYRDGFLRSVWETGAELVHWCVEFQVDRRLPHLHGCIFYPSGTEVDSRCEYLVSRWMQVVSETNSVRIAQQAEPLQSIGGWLIYCAKHMARGSSHVQRDMRNAPLGWDMNHVGRVWGKRGSWPTSTRKEDVSWPVAFAYQRLLAVYMSRSTGSTRSKKFWESFEPKPDRGLCAWIPESDQVYLLDVAHYSVFGGVRQRRGLDGRFFEDPFSKGFPGATPLCWQIGRDLMRSLGLWNREKIDKSDFSRYILR